jgi:hypothetical protein
MIAFGGAVNTASATAGLGGLGGLGLLGPVGLQSSPFGSSWVSGATRSGDGGQTRSLRVAPSMDFRVSKNILLGGALGVSHTTSTSGNAGAAGSRFTSWAAEGLVRVGYMAELGQGFLLVPRLGAGAEYGRSVFRVGGTQVMPAGGAFDALVGRMEADVSLLVPLRGPLYLSAGPSLRAATLLNASADGASAAAQSLDTLSFGASAGLTAAF